MNIESKQSQITLSNIYVVCMPTEKNGLQNDNKI